MAISTGKRQETASTGEQQTMLPLWIIVYYEICYFFQKTTNLTQLKRQEELHCVRGSPPSIGVPWRLTEFLTVLAQTTDTVDVEEGQNAQCVILVAAVPLAPFPAPRALTPTRNLHLSVTEVFAKQESVRHLSRISSSSQTVYPI